MRSRRICVVRLYGSYFKVCPCIKIYITRRSGDHAFHAILYASLPHSVCVWHSYGALSSLTLLFTTYILLEITSAATSALSSASAAPAALQMMSKATAFKIAWSRVCCIANASSLVSGGAAARIKSLPLTRFVAGCHSDFHRATYSAASSAVAKFPMLTLLP